MHKKQNLNLKQQPSLRTAHIRVRISGHNYHTQHSTEQF